MELEHEQWKIGISDIHLAENNLLEAIRNVGNYKQNVRNNIRKSGVQLAKMLNFDVENEEATKRISYNFQQTFRERHELE